MIDIEVNRYSAHNKCGIMHKSCINMNYIYRIIKTSVYSTIGITIDGCIIVAAATVVSA